MKLDFRDRVILENGCICAHTKGMYFDLLAPDSSLLVRCRNEAAVFQCPVFEDAEGRELARIRFLWWRPQRPLLQLADGREEELSVFRKYGTELSPVGRIELLNVNLKAESDVLETTDAETTPSPLLLAVLCFCMHYRRWRIREQQRGMIIACVAAIFNLLIHLIS